MAFIALSVKLFFPSFQSEKPNDVECSNDGRLPNKDNPEVQEQNKQGGSARGTGSNVNEVVNTLESRVTEFGKACKDIKTLAEAVKALTNDVNGLKRKRLPDDSEQKQEAQEGPSASKQANQMHDVSDSEQESDSDCGLDDFMQDAEPQQDEAQDGFEDLEEFFVAHDGVGDAIPDQLASITNRALRGKKQKKEGDKLTSLKEKHMRPSNVTNMEVPQADTFLWHQLKRQVRAVDFQMQKANNNYSQALTPIMKAMVCLKEKEYDKVAEYMKDAYKMLCMFVKYNIAGRRERIISELTPKFKALCKNEATGSCLFGDNFSEAVKKLEGSKANLTGNFLQKRGSNQRYQHQSKNYNKGYPANNPNYQRSAPQGQRFDRKASFKRKSNGNGYQNQSRK